MMGSLGVDLITPFYENFANVTEIAESTHVHGSDAN